MVKTGSFYNKMDVTLEQIGYYNPNAAASKQFLEVLIAPGFTPEALAVRGLQRRASGSMPPNNMDQ